MVELHDVTVVLKDPNPDKVRAALYNLRKMGLAFPTQLSSQSIHGLATNQVVAQLEQARDVLTLSRRLEFVEGKVTRSLDAATALKEMEEREAQREAQREEKVRLEAELEAKLGRKVEGDGDVTVYVSPPLEEKKSPEPAKPLEKPPVKKPKKTTKKKTTKKKAPAKPKKPPVKKGNQNKAKNKRKAANKSKKQNRRKRF